MALQEDEGKVRDTLDRRGVDGCIYRWDNSPHEAHRQRVSTFPHHFHHCRDHDVCDFTPPEGVGGYRIDALLELLDTVFAFVRRKLTGSPPRDGWDCAL
ncbi:toxin-antitoxin system TumE family protein [Pyrodictium abyssi]|uniref:toxin-antitoxin system TumE family protein n=1 Tax=Pyrodictium abyssi TaxID=54256 RepID=UPI003B981273